MPIDRGGIMKKIFSRLVVLLCLFNLCSQSNPIVYRSFDSYIAFDGNNVEIGQEDMRTNNITSFKGVYEILEENKVPFIYFISEDGEKHNYLILKNDYLCYVYKENGFNITYGMTGSSRRSEGLLISAEEIAASSFLTEGNIAYAPSNIDLKYRLGIPWAEGIPGHGINETLTIRIGNIKRLYISIGYVSYQKPYLYEQNSRPKKLELFVKDKFCFEVELEDTPNYQTIDLPQRLLSEDNLVIKILDVYPGTKYEDTCINSIFYDIVDSK